MSPIVVARNIQVPDVRSCSTCLTLRGSHIGFPRDNTGMRCTGTVLSDTPVFAQVRRIAAAAGRWQPVLFCLLLCLLHPAASSVLGAVTAGGAARENGHLGSNSRVYAVDSVHCSKPVQMSSLDANCCAYVSYYLRYINICGHPAHLLCLFRRNPCVCLEVSNPGAANTSSFV